MPLARRLTPAGIVDVTVAATYALMDRRWQYTEQPELAREIVNHVHRVLKNPTNFKGGDVEEGFSPRGAAWLAAALTLALAPTEPNPLGVADLVDDIGRALTREGAVEVEGAEGGGG